MWVATEWTGLSAVMGSWKTMAISRPRRSRSAAGDSRSTSRPLYRISPPSTTALGASRLITAETTVVLPLPLSPTSPTMLRAGTASETPRTARTGPARRVEADAQVAHAQQLVRQPSDAPAKLRVQHVPQRLAEEREAERRHDEGARAGHDEPGGRRT